MVRKQIKGRLFVFMLLAIFFLLGGPALAKEESLSPPNAVLRAKSFVYNGEVQYITLDSVSHPLESQGQYAFSWYKNGELLPCASEALPIRYASDSGIYYCKVSFTKDGKTSEKVTDAVEIRMLKKTVDIPEISPLVYSGYRQYPAIYETAEYIVSKNEGATEAGGYFVTLTLKDGENLSFPSLPDAEISSDGMQISLPYTVERAENLFSTPLSVPICYEGSAPSPKAFSKFGTVLYQYYSDAEGIHAIAPPTKCGTYYIRASVAGNESVHPLVSSLVRFEILPLTVSALRVLSLPSRLSYLAFDSFSAEGISVVATLADGSIRALSPEDLTVIYPSGAEYLLAKDTHVLLSYGGASVPIAIEVARIPLDFSAVVWSESGWVYDGAEREITLSGLPPAANVISYLENHITDAGEYVVSALLSFDRENYDGPQSLTCKLTVARQSVPIPSLAPAVYSGALLSPSLAVSPLYKLADSPRVLHAGKYPVSLCLADAKNYVFEGAESAEIEIFFEVLPMPLCAMIEDVYLYLGEKFSLPSYRVIAGTPCSGDDLGFYAKEIRGGYAYGFENPDYAVTYEGGLVERTYRLPPEAESALLLGCAVLLVVTLAVFCLILLYRKKIRPLSGGASRAVGSPCTYPLFSKRESSALDAPEVPYRIEQADPPPIRQDAIASSEKGEDDASPETEISPSGTCVDAVDASTADALITDALAEALVMAEERVIYTEGSRHGVINVDTLSAAFAPGEEVDINRLKKKKLIAQDVGYLKVLSRGSIDKPLTVYADDFSLGAIKMIALTGGRTFHVKTLPLP